MDGSVASIGEQGALPPLPVSASILARVRLGIRCLNILKDDPANPYYGPLLTVTMDRERFAAIARSWRQDGRAELLEQRPTLQGLDLDLEALGRLPEGTLGFEFARYFRDNGIAPFVTTFAVEDDVDYLCKRYRETHDLFHLVTRYGTDEEGEMELQAFVLGNLGIRHAALILAFSVPRRAHLRGVRSVPSYVRKLRAAFQRGRRADEILSVRYQTLWSEPVTRLTETLCPTPGKHAPRSRDRSFR